ncbi:MAG: ABC transporter permease, partial [bacterium]|nr:ABC transporter permease [bacterium]
MSTQTVNGARASKASDERRSTMASGSTGVLIRRNLTVFLRDRGKVFFAVLAPLVLLMLYVLFLGRMQTEQMLENIPNSTESAVNGFIYSWVLAGMVMISTLTASLGAAEIFVADRVAGRFKEFRVSPVRNTELVVGYLVSSVIISVVISLAVLVVGSVMFGLMYDSWATPIGYAMAAGYTLLLCFIFSALSAFVVTFTRSEGAYSGLATLVGTLSGFLAFAYIPIGAVSKTVASVLTTLPFAQGAMLLRDPIAGGALEEALSPLPEGPRAEAMAEIREGFGYDAYIGDFQLQPWMVVVILVVLTVALTALAAWRIG